MGRDGETDRSQVEQGRQLDTEGQIDSRFRAARFRISLYSELVPPGVRMESESGNEPNCYPSRSPKEKSVRGSLLGSV